MKKADKYWNTIHKIGWIAAAIIGGVAAFFIVFAFGSKVKQLHAYQDRYDALQHRIEITEAQTKKIKRDHQQFLTDPVFVERIAHQVGYAKKDEIIFEFPDDESK